LAWKWGRLLAVCTAGDLKTKTNVSLKEGLRLELDVVWEAKRKGKERNWGGGGECGKGGSGPSRPVEELTVRGGARTVGGKDDLCGGKS